MKTTILALCMSALIGIVISCGGGGPGMPDNDNGSGTFESDDTPDQTPDDGTEPVAVIEADTLSGLVFSELGRPPEEGDEAVVGDTKIRVETMEDLGVLEVSLKLSPGDSVAPYSEWEVVDHE